MMVNPRRLFWDPDLAPARDFRAFISNPSLAKLRTQASRERLGAVARWMLAAPKRSLSRPPAGGQTASAEQETDAAFEQLRAASKTVTLLFSDHEPLHDEFVTSGRMARLAQWTT